MKMLLDGESLKSIEPKCMNKEELAEFLKHARHYARNDSADQDLLTDKIKSVINRAMTIGCYKGIVEAYQVLALIQMSCGDNEMAASALEMSETFIRKYRMSEEAMLELYNTYVIFYQDYCGDPEAAAKMCQKGIALSRQENKNDMVMKFSANLGVLYLTSGAFEDAADLISGALNYYESLRDDIRRLYCHSNLGEAYIGLGLYHEAAQQYSLAMDMAIELEEGTIIEEAALGLAKINRINGEPQKALEMLEATLRHLQSKSRLVLGDKLIFEVVALYIESGDILMADVWLKEYEETYGDGNHTIKDLKYFDLKARVAVGFGDYKAAYLMDKKHHELYLESTATKAEQVIANIKANELSRAMERLKTIGNIGRKLTMNLTHENVLQELYEALDLLMPTDCIGIGTIHGKEVDYAYYMSDMDDRLEFRVPLEACDNLGNWCIRRKKELMINDISAEGDLYISKIRRVFDRTEGKVTQSILYIPLMVDGVVIGLFTVQSYSTMAYSSEDLETLKVIGSYLAVRLQNAEQARILKELSHRDPLTGVYSRSGLIRHCEKLMADYKQTVHMIMLDLDHFKGINDRFGHMTGDSVLARFGAVLSTVAVECGGIPARLGGEEFALIIPDRTDAYCESIAERIHDAVKEIKLSAMGKHRVTTSIGIYHYWGKEAPNLDLLYKYADKALYRAKEGGRDRIVVCEPEDMSA